jgi:AmmeMemoRadiSam system protein A
MVPSSEQSSANPDRAGLGARNRLADEERRVLRSIAWESIRRGLEQGVPSDPDPDAFEPALQEIGASFVTLRIGEQLRGCVGSFEARFALVQDVARNAYAAAFRDHRFPALADPELAKLDLHISILTPLEPFPVEDRTDLLRRIQPGRDGLLLEDTPYRAIFLPQVWDSLPAPQDFLEELLLKAGLARNHWSDSIRFYRYRVEEF